MNYGIFSISYEYDNHLHIKNLLPWSKNDKTNKSKISNQYGFLLKINDKFLILANKHGFPYKNSINNIFFEFTIEDKPYKIELDVKKEIFELDFLFLKIKKKKDLNFILKNFKPITIDLINEMLLLENDNVYIYDKNKNKIILKIYSMNQGIFMPYQYTDNIFYNINLEDELINEDFLNLGDDLSGYPIFQDNKLVGIINGLSENTLYIIPSVYLLRVFKEIIKYNTFEGICSLYFNYELIEKKNLPDSITYKYKKLNYLNITNTLGISYNLYSKILNKKKLGNFKKNDIILEIDDIPLEEDMMYIPEYNMKINFIIYNCLKKSEFCKTKFKILRKNKKNEYNEKIIEIYNRNISSIKNVNYNPITKFYEYNNKYLIELNKNLLIYLIENQLINHEMYSFFDGNISNSDNKKIILIVNEDFKFENELLILININNMQISNLDNISKNLKKESNNFKMKNILNNKIIELNL